MNAVSRITASLTIAIVVAGCSDTESNRFRSVEIARQAGIFARGWFPDVLPESAGPLREHHDRDTNARCGMARFATDDMDRVLARARTIGFVEHEGTPSAPALAWCPFTEEERRRATVLLTRDTSSGREFVGLSTAGELFFWSVD